MMPDIPILTDMSTNAPFAITALKMDRNLPVQRYAQQNAFISGTLMIRTVMLSVVLKKRKSKTLIPEAGTNPQLHFLI